MAVAAHLVPTLQLEKCLPPSNHFRNRCFQKKDILTLLVVHISIDLALAVAFLYNTLHYIDVKSCSFYIRS